MAFAVVALYRKQRIAAKFIEITATGELIDFLMSAHRQQGAETDQIEMLVGMFGNDVAVIGWQSVHARRPYDGQIGTGQQYPKSAVL